ncbi:MAG: extracellular solute-binding protein [Chloroflexi bacterium]|nr:extracellular solute-binding protein [Chloroflexota bacterium]
MLTRRSLLAVPAALAAGCSAFGARVSSPVAPQSSEINVAAFTKYASLSTASGAGGLHESPEEKYQQAAAVLAEDRDSPFGPVRGGYTLALRFFEDDYSKMEEPPRSQEEFQEGQAAALEAAAGILDSLEADLVTVWPEEARWWGRSGLLLPLDRFTGPESTELNREFYPSVLNQYQVDGVQYALPVDAAPLMLFYDEAYLASLGVPPPDTNWHWDDVARHAATLTRRGSSGFALRWGLVARGQRIFWALWQNEASLVDMDTLQCSLQEPAAVAALQFVHDLMHKHRVSPIATRRDLWSYIYQTPPALLYSYPPLHLNQQSGFRMAPLPRGKVHTAPVRTTFGIGIAARTPKMEAAYTALRGFTRAMQAQAVIPASREAMAGLADTHKHFLPEEVAAVQHTMAHGREWPQYGLPLHVMDELTGSLGRGDDVATVVNAACSTIDDFRQTGKLQMPWD